MEKRKVVKCVIDEEGRLGITAMGLVDAPAIEENWIALSKQKLSAVNEERRMLYGPALIPDKQILRYDDKGEPYYVYFEKDTVQKVAHQFFKKNLQHTTNLQHEIPVTGVTVVESWLKEGPQDKSIQLGLPDLPDGTWFIGTYVDEDAVWEDVKAGKVKGYSIEGFFNEVGVSMSGVKNYEAELLLEIEGILKNI